MFRKLNQPTGSDPYRVKYRFEEIVEGSEKPFERRAVQYYEGTKKGQHDLIEKQFKKDFKHLKLISLHVISVDWMG